MIIICNWGLLRQQVNPRSKNAPVFFRDPNEGPPRGKPDGVIGHISKLENGNWMKKFASLRDISIWHPARLDKLEINMDFRQFLGVIGAKSLRESGISSLPWGPQ